jgi:3-aminobutyryl-CoA ammonia-lyase
MPYLIEAQVVCRPAPVHGPSAATVLAEPLIAVTATGAIVVPA